jgi:hypothetical protein
VSVNVHVVHVDLTDDVLHDSLGTILNVRYLSPWCPLCP